jgi:hypothetical protein
MMGTQRFKIVIANEIPERLREGRLYVSLKYRTASHLCPCGCGNRVVTPFSSGYWTMRVVLWGVTLPLLDSQEPCCLGPSNKWQIATPGLAKASVDKWIQGCG